MLYQHYLDSILPNWTAGPSRELAASGDATAAYENVFSGHQLLLFQRALIGRFGGSGRTGRTGIEKSDTDVQLVARVHTHLDPGLAEVEHERELLPGEDVRVLGLLERALQLVQLEGGEGGARAADLARRTVRRGIVVVVAETRRVVVKGACLWRGRRGRGRRLLCRGVRPPQRWRNRRRQMRRMMRRRRRRRRVRERVGQVEPEERGRPANGQAGSDRGKRAEGRQRRKGTCEACKVRHDLTMATRTRTCMQILSFLSR